MLYTAHWSFTFMRYINLCWHWHFLTTIPQHRHNFSCFCISYDFSIPSSSKRLEKVEANPTFFISLWFLCVSLRWSDILCLHSHSLSIFHLTEQCMAVALARDLMIHVGSCSFIVCVHLCQWRLYTPLMLLLVSISYVDCRCVNQTCIHDR